MFNGYKDSKWTFCLQCITQSKSWQRKLPDFKNKGLPCVVAKLHAKRLQSLFNIKVSSETDKQWQNCKLTEVCNIIRVSLELCKLMK